MAAKTQAPKKPSARNKAAQPAGRAAKACPARNCTPSSVTLTVEKNLLTLKHNRNCKIKINVTPRNLSIDGYRIEIRRASDAVWCTLAHQKAMNPWRAAIAGKFKIRGVVRICGVEHLTPESDVEVQFPEYSQIVGDPRVRRTVRQSWRQTLADCTARPNRRRERGFWIRLNTHTNTYEFTRTTMGPWVGPAAGASVTLSPPTRPADIPPGPTPCARGARYSVASFHTHTSTAYRGTALAPGPARGIGPSAADQQTDTADDIPGLVYDYVDSPAGSGNIPVGHPKNSPAQLYHSMGTNRRTTPP